MDQARTDLPLARRFSVDAVSMANLHIQNLLRDTTTMLGLEPGIAAFEQVGRQCHYRFDFASDLAVGHGEMCAVTDGLMLQMIDAEPRGPRVLEGYSPDMLRIRIAIEGLEGYASPGLDPVIVDGPATLVVIEPPEASPFQMAFNGRCRMAHLYADRPALKRFCEGQEIELPAVLRTYLAGQLTEPFVRRASLKPDMLRCLEDLLACEQDGWARTLFLRAKAMEIFCHLLKVLEHDEGFGAPEASQITARGVLRAQAILKERFAAPPSLDDLAREVGVSRSGLCAGFRQLLGKPIFGYIQDLRMERALALLHETQDSITEIAHAVGYGHLSNFTVAVQRRFGMSPSELRRGTPAER